MKNRPSALAFRARKSGFTLIELLTVIAIIGILAAILIPVVGRVRESARSSQCTSQLREMGNAILLYTNDYNGRTPPSRDPQFSGGGRTIARTLWPYAGYEPESYGEKMSGRSGNAITLFDCPSSALEPIPTPPSQVFHERYHSYALNSTPSGIFHGSTEDGFTYGFPLRLLESSTHTVSIFETSHYYGDHGRYRTYGLMPHSGGSNFLFWDGHVEHYVYENVPSGRTHIFWGGEW